MAEAEDLGGDGERKDSEINEEETQSSDCEKQAEEVEDLENEKSGEPTEEEKKQYKEYRLQKIFSKINCDLSSPCLKTSEIKEKINSSLSNGFNCYLLLTSKVKAVKKQLKVKPDLGAVIGIGESTYLARIFCR